MLIVTVWDPNLELPMTYFQLCFHKLGTGLSLFCYCFIEILLLYGSTKIVFNLAGNICNKTSDSKFDHVV